MRLALKPSDLPLLGLGAFTLLYAMYSLSLPFGWDHGMMASAADIWRRGGVLYLDAWEMKGPLAYVPFYVATVLFGPTMWGIRIVELAILIPALWCFARLMATLTGRAIGAGAALAQYLWPTTAGFFFTAQPDIWVAAVTSIAVMLAIAPSTARAPMLKTFFLIGVMIGSTGLVKPHYLAFGLAPLIALATMTGHSVSRRIRLAGALAGGAALPVVVCVAYFASQGALGAFIDAFLIFNLTTYVGPYPEDDYFLARLVAHLLATPVSTLAPLAALGLWSRRREATVVYPLCAWIAVALCVVVVQGKLFTYHWFVFHPPLIVAAALGVHALLAAKPGGAVMAGAAAAVFFAQVAMQPARDILGWVKQIASGAPEEERLRPYARYSYKAAEISAAARHVRERTRPEDGVFVWGNDSAIRYLADRPNPTVITHMMPVRIDGPLRAAYRDEMMRDLLATPPVYIAIGSPWPEGDKAEAFAMFPEFSAFVRERYQFETAYGAVHLYRLKSPQG